MPSWCAKLKLLIIQLFVTFLIDYVPRFWKWLTCQSVARETVVTVESDTQMRHLFALDTVEGLIYPDPRLCGDVGTMVCAFRPRLPVPYQRVVEDGPDGNPIGLDFFLAPDSDEEEEKSSDTASSQAADTVFTRVATPTLVVIFPGLASSSSTNYIERLVWHFHHNGFHVCVFNARGLGDTPLVTPRLMSAAWTGDVRHLSRPGHALHRDALERRCGVAERGSLCILGAGLSLGGLILTKYVGEEGAEAARTGAQLSLSLDALLVVNSPLDSVASSVVMRTRTLNKRFYNPNMATGLVDYARTHKEILADLPGLPGTVRESFQKGEWEKVFKRIHSIYDYDALINARANGFETPDDYYAAVSPLLWLPHVHIPVVCIGAADDPIVGPPPVSQLRDLMTSVTPNLAYVQIPFGGHLGYVKSPMREWRQEPSFMEALVVRLAKAFSQFGRATEGNSVRRAHEPVGAGSTSAVSFSSLEHEAVQV